METVADTTFEELNAIFREYKKPHDEFLVSNKTSDVNTCPELDKNRPENLFNTLITRMEQILLNTPKEDEQHMKILSMKSSLLYEQAKILMSKDKLDHAEEMFETALNEIFEYREHKQITFLHMRLINHLAYLLSKKGEFERARQLLESILEDIEVKNNLYVYSTDELFSNREIDQSQSKCKLNKLVANNLQMLGWVYGRLGKPETHAAKQHMALEHQLEAGDCDPVNWACRCSRLAALYLSQCKWIPARYHLIAAGAVLDRLEREMVVHPDLARAQADLARGWINYGLHLFSNSKAHLYDRKYPGNFNGDVSTSADDTKNKQEETVELLFSALEINTDGIPARPVRTTEEARNLFLHTHTWLKRARLYYTLRDFPIHYVNAVLDLSELYRFLSFYEPDLDSQYNVQKRRADALETLSAVLREVRPQCYIAVSVELLRELAEVQIEMMGINLRRLHVTGDDSVDNEGNIKQRISAISNIQMKLEGVGDMLGHAVFEEQENIKKGPHSSRDQSNDVEYMPDVMENVQK